MAGHTSQGKPGRISTEQFCPHGCGWEYPVKSIGEVIKSETDADWNFVCLNEACGRVISIGDPPHFRLTCAVGAPVLKRPSGRISRSMPALKDEIVVPVPTSGDETMDFLKPSVSDEDPTKSKGHLPMDRALEIIRLQARIGAAVERKATFDNGRYKTIEVVGKGGAGIVVACEDTQTGQVVALKFQVGTNIKDNQGRLDASRAKRALRVQGLFIHTSVLRPMGSFVDKEFGLVTVEQYIRGVPLSKAIANGESISEETTRDIARSMLQVLVEAETHGVVHRDIKPQNIMMDERGRAYLVDFGLARECKDADVKGDMSATGARGKRDLVARLNLARASKTKLSDSEVEDLSVSLTGKDDVLGTPRYLAPELIGGGEADYRSDLYGLGATLFHIVTGELPVNGINQVDILRNVLRHDVAFAYVVGQRKKIPITREFSQLLTRLLRRDPEERFSSARKALEALDALPPLVRAPIKAVSGRASHQQRTPIKLGRALFRLLFWVLLLSAFACAVYFYFNGYPLFLR